MVYFITKNNGLINGVLYHKKTHGIINEWYSVKLNSLDLQYFHRAI